MSIGVASVDSLYQGPGGGFGPAWHQVNARVPCQNHDAGVPATAVQQFNLQAGPERLDHRVIEAAPDAAHRGDQAGVGGAAGERP
jgi:hypothetical protein